MSNSNDRYADLKKGKKRKKKKKRHKADPLDNMVISHLGLKRTLGFLGILLPFVLMFCSFVNDCKILPSISDYYHTSVQIIFTSSIIAIAVFLISYNGLDYKEKIIYKIAAIAATLVAIFPTPINEKYKVREGVQYTIEDFNQFQTLAISSHEFVGHIHFFCAAVFFMLLSYMVYFKFVFIEKESTSPSIKRIWLYRFCGGGMFLSILFIAIFKMFLSGYFDNPESWVFPVTFTGEAIALILFGISWLVKGEIEEIEIKNT